MRIEFRDDQPIVDGALIAPLMDMDVIGFQVLMQSGGIAKLLMVECRDGCSAPLRGHFSGIVGPQAERICPGVAIGFRG